MISLFQDQIKTGNIIYNGFSLLPSIIADAPIPFDNSYVDIINRNYLLYNSEQDKQRTAVLNEYLHAINNDDHKKDN